MQSDLTPAQKRAATSIDTSMAVVAGAGSGKTRVLIERSTNIIESSANAIDHILIITFTEKASSELTLRLKKKMGRKYLSRISSAWISTFHAFCARILRIYAPVVSLDPSFNIIDENAAKLLTEKSIEECFLNFLDNNDEDAALMVEELEYKNAISLLSELMDFRWHADALQTGDDKLLGAALNVYSKIKTHYLSQLTIRNSLDFQEIEIKTLELLEKQSDVLLELQKKFKHILVDEYQDTNDIQAKLITLLFDPKRNHLFIVGDPRQSIYRFRGANVSCFASTVELILANKGEVNVLSDNFRSSEDIVLLANKIAKPLNHKSLSDSAELIARSENNGTPSVITLSCKHDHKTNIGEKRKLEAEAIAAYIDDIVKNENVKYGDIAMLFQAITASEIYETALRNASIPARVYGGRFLLERSEVTDLLAALSFSSDQKNDTALITLVRSPLIGLSDDECVILAGENGKDFRKNVMDHPKANPLLSFLANAKKHRAPSEILQAVLDLTGYEIFCANTDPSGSKRASIDKIIMLAKSIEREAPVTLSSFVEFVNRLRKENARLGDPPTSADTDQFVKCMTIHGAKGLEFPVVILPDLIRAPSNSNSGTTCFIRGVGIGFRRRDTLKPFGEKIKSERYEELSLLNKSEEEAESLRLLYVAVTRAMNRLILPMHEGEDIKGRWHKWLEPLLTDAVSVTKQPVCHSERSEESQAIEKPRSFVRLRRTQDDMPHTPTNKPFTVSELESFDRCPQEYYLKYVVTLPASQILPFSSHGLPANLRGSIIHSVIENLKPNTNNDIHELVKQQCLTHEIIPTESICNQLLKSLEPFCRSELYNDLANGERELKFDWMFDNHIITGKIDWLRVSGDNLEIVDFKTDRVQENEMEKRANSYSLQMTAYALAVEAARKKPVHQTQLYFMDIHKSHIVSFNDDRRISGKKRIEEIIGKITESNFSIDNFTPPCVSSDCTCPYHLNGLCWLDRGKSLD